MTDISDWTAAELAKAYRECKASPVEVTKAVLDRANRSQKALNAFCFVDAESALAAARDSENRWRVGDPRSPIDGVHVSVKDNIATTGMPTRFGSRALADDQIWRPDSPSVARLREAGTIIFGKTCCPDFGHKIVTDSPLTGVTRNPWSVTHTPGGSSGGASAAVAASIGALAIGTDAGGSIRIPAAFTGTFGFKPSFGRVPHHPRGAYAPVSHISPLTRSVEDAALMMNVIAQADAGDWYALPAEAHDYVAALGCTCKGLKIAYSEKLGLDDVSVAADVQRAVQNAASVFRSLGAVVEPDDPPAIPACREVFRIMSASFAAKIANDLGDRRLLLDHSLDRLARRGEALSREAFVNAVIARGEIGSEIKQFFERYDLVICPVFQSAAPTLAECEISGPPIPAFTSWCNLSGVPAASVFCGLTDDGLPIGLQIAGKPYSDPLVLSACHAFERAFGRAPRPSRQLF